MYISHNTMARSRNVYTSSAIVTANTIPLEQRAFMVLQCYRQQ